MKGALLLVAAIAGCSATPTPKPTDPMALRVVIPGVETLYGVAWYDADTLVISRGTDEGSRLFTVEQTTGVSQQIRLGPLPSGCDGIDDLSPVAAPVGFSWLRVCKRGAAARMYSLMNLAPGGQPSVMATFDTPFPVGAVTSDATDWIVDLGSRICNTIIRVTPRGLAPIHITVESPDGGFDTGLDVRDDCERMGVSRNPAVREGRLAFVASTGAIGKTGTARLMQPSDLYIAPVAGGRADRIAVGIIDPSDVLWIDATHIVVSGERPLGTFGTWTVDIVSGDVRAVLPFAARSVSLSPDGAFAVAMRATQETVIADEVVILPASLLAP